eukprot:CAMPEP_0202707156 /NCGR_PEP_ID=MMETSP1385-20130828/19502_1 /ASSEMBLY_ACC=CAM_ASM_000861 /TAXON_ID=933848 /ORGANISM="Elphidium margaritaceum" /LENGTH=66 /DNA_ID=CAMNT_0049365803 /DNA_START=40 /DNA_END=240 /DNA_ORIENTATION=-
MSMDWNFFSVMNGGFMTLIVNALFIFIAIALLVCYIRQRGSKRQTKSGEAWVDGYESEINPMIEAI